MNEKLLISGLKKQLKSKGIDYTQIAQALGLSLSTIRRDFSLENMGLQRLFKICNTFDIPPEFLFSSEKQEKRTRYALTTEQDNFFSKNIKYWGFLDLLRRGLSSKEICKKFRVSPKEEAKYLRKLDQFNLIEWGPRNKIRVIHETIYWQEDGSLKKAFLKLEENLFLDNKFKKKNEFYSFFMDEIPLRSIDKIILEFKKIEDMIEVENQLSKHTDNQKSVGVMMGIRPWDYNPLDT